MKKLLIYLVVIIFCLPNIFILYKTFNVLDNLDSLPKKTGWVKGYEYWGMGKKKNLSRPKIGLQLFCQFECHLFV